MSRSNNGFVILNIHIKTALLLQFVLITAMTAVQSFPVCSVPVSTIRLAHNSKYEYGVLGWCVKQPQRQCTGTQIGYNETTTESSIQKLLLPSDSKYSVSKLLLFHIISFGLSIILWSMIVIAMISPLQESPLFLLLFTLLMIAMFLFALLSWLVDILLFRIWLDWPGWLMLVVAITSAFCGSAIWSYRRSVEIRNYTVLNEEDSVVSINQIEVNNKRRDIESRTYQESIEMMHIVESDPMMLFTSDISNNDPRIRTLALEDELREPDITYHRIVEG
ncbi:hypothetical protein RI543_000398 [Arxiozyma heterogenica]|uniref:PH-response regulator protein palI/RIM9 n=1 Tax=Arxiozyma heterogenica TaxID=278026 RepID=A0AAN7W638_9SACH|nr:hypothetical protein RI543_000398 [Kazachstania heterogenica]